MGGLNEYTLITYKAMDPGPVEWAYFIISLVCLGTVDDGNMRASQFPSQRHSELDRIRWVLNLLKNKGKTPRYLHDDNLKYRSSIHQLPSRCLDEWVEQLCLMLKACRQGILAEALKRYASASALLFQGGETNLGTDNGVLGRQGGGRRKKALKNSPFVLDRKDTLGVLDMGVTYYKQVRRCLSHFLHRLETKFGYFLPYDLSIARGDEFFRSIEDLARDENIKTAVVIGAANGKATTEAFLRGIMQNVNKPSVFCMNGATGGFLKLWKKYARNPAITCYRISASREQYADDLESTVRRIKREKQISYFDAVLIDSSEASDEVTVNRHLNDCMHRARFVLLDDINSFFNFQKHRQLLTDHNYVLVAENPDLRKGYAIFKRNISEGLAVDRVEVQAGREEQKLGVDRWREAARVAGKM
jgi:hypothetical protein